MNIEEAYSIRSTIGVDWNGRLRKLQSQIELPTSKPWNDGGLRRTDWQRDGPEYLRDGTCFSIGTHILESHSGIMAHECVWVCVRVRGVDGVRRG